VFSPDGSKVAFLSRTGNLVPVPTSGSGADVYVRDLVAGTTTLVSASPDGTGGGYSESSQPVFLDNTKLAFASDAQDLGPTDSTFAPDIYVRDLEAGTTSMLSANSAGTDTAGGMSRPLRLSPDGTRLAFVSSGTFGSEPGGQDGQLYVRDLTTGAIEQVTVDAAGTTGGNGGSGDWFVPNSVAFSSDGRLLSFTSEASNLGPTDTNGLIDVFVRDLEADVTQLVSSNATGTDSASGRSETVTFAGAEIAFLTTAGDLGPADAGSDADIYLARLVGADLAVTATATPDPVASGGEVTYSVSLANRGPDTADDAVIAVVTPMGTTVVSSTSTSGSCAPVPGAGHVLTCPVGDVATGGGADVEVVVQIGTPEEATLQAHVSVGSETLDPDGRNTVGITTSVVGLP
jgi:uncharacterized repeat protein (TIGR01451 family)